MTLRADAYQIPSSLSRIGVVPRCFEPFSLDSALGRFVLFEQVEGDAIEHGEVLSRVASAFAVKVFAKTHIQHPVQFCLWFFLRKNHANGLRSCKDLR
jgi:hypothetical protein